MANIFSRSQGLTQEFGPILGLFALIECVLHVASKYDDENLQFQQNVEKFATFLTCPPHSRSVQNSVVLFLCSSRGMMQPQN